MHRYFLLLAVIAVGVTVLLLPQEILLQELLNLGMSLGTTILVSEVIFRTARELRQQQKFIHSVLNVVPSHIFVKDRSGRYTLVNEAFAKFLDMTPDEILNKQTEQVSVDPNFRF
ncbi:cell wall metabolism sensor histidine kinase WalK [Chloroflexi bacterium TSY]|nr:cell wall metabolism sensor histidine kinase WalK [Chloroflexi bacterium TSY]